jgi:hypothetical protein
MALKRFRGESFIFAEFHDIGSSTICTYHLSPLFTDKLGIEYYFVFSSPKEKNILSDTRISP